MIEPIYVSRQVGYLSAMGLAQYAASIGLKDIVPDMHVTLAYSTIPVDWDHAAFQMDPRRLTVTGGTPETRKVEKFNSGAIVLNLPSRSLSERWAQFIMAGASWDHPDFRPHITLAYDASFDIDSVSDSYTSEVMLERESREWLYTDPIQLHG